MSVNLTHFKLSEFDCKCGCGRNNMDEKFLLMLDRARAMAGVPFVIESGSRCPKRNAEVGSKSKNHIEGKASDIRVSDGQARGKILKGLYLAGFKRIGLIGKVLNVDGAWKAVPTGIHVDSMPEVESFFLEF